VLTGPIAKCALCGRVVVSGDPERMFLAQRVVHATCAAANPTLDISAQPSHPLLRAGYYREFTRKPRNPELSKSVRPCGEPDEARIIRYLESGTTAVPSTQEVRDPLDVQRPTIGRDAIMTDGIWDWPDYLPALVERYHVQLPTEFIDHMRAANWVPETQRGVRK